MCNHCESVDDKLFKMRHSYAHVMAQAVKSFYPDAKITIGPPIKDGFYYDFDIPETLSENDLEKFEAKMKEIIKGQHDFICREYDASELRDKFHDEPYKLELIDDLIKDDPGVKLTTYTQDTFEDLCRGPHVENTKQLRTDSFKLTRVAGAYWRGDENRPMLQRIYGTAWQNKKDLKAHLERIEEAKKRDHRLLGKQMDLFSFSDEVGPGLSLWHPKGASIRMLSQRFSEDAHKLNGYLPVITPHIGRSKLWQTSGHLDFYKDGMYSAIDVDGDEYYLKPMNCPFHSMIFKNGQRSYKELPMRLAEFGTVYRYEKSGTLSGLTRVRGFTQDDAHIFCTPEQVEGEIRRALNFSLYVLRSFGLDKFTAYISTRPAEKSVGDDADWDMATKSLEKAVEEADMPVVYDEGGGAFYGPKIDIKFEDTLGREQQLSTIQFDFNLPRRFELEYKGTDGEMHTPYMVHRALFGSIERFVAILLETHAGELPLWVAPTQATIVPITEKHNEAAFELQEKLAAEGLRVIVDDSAERMQAKIRKSEMDKVPYALVLGDKEIEQGEVAVRQRGKGNQGNQKVADFVASLQEAISQGIPQALE